MDITIPATPRPRPPAVDVPRGLTIDVVTAKSAHHLAWVARTSAGATRRFIQPRKAGSLVVATLVTSLAKWFGAFSEPEITVRVFNGIVRDALREAGVQNITFAHGLQYAAAQDWALATNHDLAGELERLEEGMRARRVMYGATDGARHPRHGNGAFAWVNVYGDFMVGRAPGGILDAEVAGILSFVRNIPHHFGKAVVFVDSLDAIAALQDGSARIWMQNDQEALMETLQRLRTGSLELIWVRSHQGHPLNDLADRLALMRHRAVRNELTSREIDHAARQIVDGEREKLRSIAWDRERSKALKLWREHTAAHVSLLPAHMEV